MKILTNLTDSVFSKKDKSYMNNYTINKLHLLIKSGIPSNIELAIQLAEHAKIPTKKLIEPWSELIEILELNSDYDCLSDQLIDLMTSKSLLIPLSKGFAVPKSIIHLPYLENLDLSCNDLDFIPEEICQLRTLSCLELQENRLNKLPKNIHLLSNLKFLYLQNNPLFPSEKERVIKSLPNTILKF